MSNKLILSIALVGGGLSLAALPATARGDYPYAETIYYHGHAAYAPAAYGHVHIAPAPHAGYYDSGWGHGTPHGYPHASPYEHGVYAPGHYAPHSDSHGHYAGHGYYGGRQRHHGW